MTQAPAALAEALHRAALRLLRRLRREDDASGLSAPRLSALSVLVFRGPQTLGALAAAEQVKRPTMTRLVQGLERDGLVRRASHPGDARSFVIEATSRGRVVMERGKARRVARLEGWIRKLPAAERSALGAAVAVMLGLGEEGATSRPNASTPPSSGSGPRPRRAPRPR
ncbi:MAG: MarR family winged helix-turn-helix transcriptional regulator [Burkholderiales bacterium]